MVKGKELERDNEGAVMAIDGGASTRGGTDRQGWKSDTRGLEAFEGQTTRGGRENTRFQGQRRNSPYISRGVKI
jgi:hypothetical protein